MSYSWYFLSNPRPQIALYNAPFCYSIVSPDSYVCGCRASCHSVWSCWIRIYRMYGYMQLYTDAMKIVFAKIEHLPDSGPTISETNDEITTEIFSRVVMWSLGMSHIMSPPTVQWGSLGLRTQMSPRPNAYQLTETRRNAWPTKSHQSIMVTIQSHTLYTPYTVRRTKLSKLKKMFCETVLYKKFEIIFVAMHAISCNIVPYYNGRWPQHVWEACRNFCRITWYILD